MVMILTKRQLLLKRVSPGLLVRTLPAVLELITLLILSKAKIDEKMAAS